MYRVKWFLQPLLFAVDAVGSILFFWKKLKPFPKNIKKILVIRLDHIGDMLLSTPVYRELKKNFPKAEVDVLCTPATKQMIENNPYVDRIFEFYSPWFSKKEFKGEKSYKEIKERLKKENFDLIIELHADPRNIVLASSLNSYSVGYGVRGLGFLLNKTAKYKNSAEHISQRDLDILKQVGIKTSKPKLDAFISKDSDKKVRNWILKNKIKSYVLMHPFTRRPEKNWSIDKWAELCGKMNETILFSGSNEDVRKINEIISKSKNKNIYNVAGKFSLKDAVSLVNHSKYLITTDTFTVHIASALNKMQIALFGPTSAKVWGPLGKSEIIQGTCRSLFGKTLPNGFKEGNHECMDAISVERVVSAVKKIRR